MCLTESSHYSERALRRVELQVCTSFIVRASRICYKECPALVFRKSRVKQKHKIKQKRDDR